MSRPTQHFTRAAIGTAAIAVLLGTLAWTRIAPALTHAPAHTAAEHAAGMGHGGTLHMTDRQMEELTLRWFESHPIRLGAGGGVGDGEDVVSLGPTYADTFFAAGGTFDTNGNTAGPADTAKILVGESILWLWESGIHTVTNGNNSSDPNSGTLFNVPHDCAHTQFEYQFDTPGLYPFYCVPHEFIAMKGYVKVSAALGVMPVPGVKDRVGFIIPPSPNPGGGAISFRFGIATGGHVRGDVFDAAGRTVATLFNHDLEAGAYAAGWDGRTGDGAAPTGVYYIRLQGPGLDDSRRVVIER